MKASIWPMLRDGIVKFFSDTQFFFTKDFTEQNYQKHFLYSLVLTIPSIWFMYEYMELAATPIWFHIFMGGFGAKAVNFVREWYYGIKYNTPCSWEDINFGTYGGIIGAIIASQIFL
jgi:hypothetical protein